MMDLILNGDAMSSKSTEALANGFNTSIKNTILFAPALAPIVINILFMLVSNPWITALGYFIASIIGFVAGCIVADMASDIICGRFVDLKKSINLVVGRLGTLIVAAIISAIFFLTFILIPVALFIITIAIVEGTDAIESTKKSFDFVIKNVVEVIVFIVIVIIIWIVFGLGFAYIPVVGAYIGVVVSWLLNVVFIVTSVYFYLSLRVPPPPLPPPPPPPT
jgi:hypothetical protein